jgi:hypothetical protein
MMYSSVSNEPTLTIIISQEIITELSSVSSTKANLGIHQFKDQNEVKTTDTVDDNTELTTWSRGLPEMLIGPHLFKKFHAFYGTWRFTTAFTRAHHLYLS